MRWLALILWLLTGPAMAQETPETGATPSEPQVEIELDQTRIIPGQSATLRVTVLVPTWMPKPVDFPSFEAPNLRVRVPERATTSISRLIDGQNWSGVSRRYLLTPMVPGVITLPAQELGITYAGPDGAPVSVTVATSDISIAGVVPEGAEDLDPFIAASDLSLSQQLSGPTTGLDAGDSVIRTITATMTGASPIVLPALTPAVNLPGIRVYQDSPQITEADDRGALSGSRIESETLMAIGGGSGTVPALSVEWFDLDTNTVQTATIEGFDVSVNGPPAKEDRPREPIDWRVVAGLILAALLVLLLLWFSLPRALRWWRQRRARHLASEAHARALLLTAVGHRDYGATLQALAAWRAKAGDVPADDQAVIDRILLRIGSGAFSSEGHPPHSGDWTELRNAISHAGKGPRVVLSEALPPLNGAA
jgi:hypothetical protein